MKVLETRTGVEIDWARQAENSLLSRAIPPMPSGAPYVVGDELWVQAGSDRFVPAVVIDRSYRARAPFGLCWVLLVNVGSYVERVTCDDNGRNRTRTHGVMPA